MSIIATFQDVNTKYFNINGSERPKIFNVIKLSEQRLSIVNVYDNQQVLFSNIGFSEIEVDGVVYGNINDLIENLNPVIFSAALIENVSQAQLNAIQEIIDSLPDNYADINHNHEGLYLTQQEILNLIAENPNASEIVSAEIVGVQLRFLDANSQVLFSVNASPFFRQGNLLQFDPDTGKLSLRNQFFTLLSQVTIQPKTFQFDDAEFITGIANDLSNLSLDKDFYVVQTLDESIYFVSALNELEFSKEWRLQFIENNFTQDLLNPDITEATFKAYELTGFDLSEIQDSDELKFNYWRIGEGGGGSQNLDQVLEQGNQTERSAIFNEGNLRIGGLTEGQGGDFEQMRDSFSYVFENGNKGANLKSDVLVGFKDYSFPNESGVITLNPSGNLPKVRVGNQWRNQHTPKSETLDLTGVNSGSTYEVEPDDYTILFLIDSIGNLNLPLASEANDRELVLIFNRFCQITPNRAILSFNGITKYDSNNIIEPGSGGLTITIKSINGDWQIIHETTA